jgi:hypothetical protein
MQTADIKQAYTQYQDVEKVIADYEKFQASVSKIIKDEEFKPHIKKANDIAETISETIDKLKAERHKLLVNIAELKLNNKN